MNWEPENDGDEMNPLLWVSLILVAIIISIAVLRLGTWC